MHDWYGNGCMGWMGIWWVLGLALIGVVIWAVVRSVQGRSGPLERGESAKDILKRRYAKGEIDRDTFQKMLEDLKG